MRLASTLLLLLFTFPLYSQTAPAVRRATAVQSVSLTNDSIVSSEDFQQAIRDIQGSRYSTNVETRIVDVARSTMRDQGYFKADVETVATEVLNETTRTRTIAVTLRIREGEQYRLKQITFEKNMLFPEAQLRQAFPIEDGEIANEDKIREGERTLGDLYATKGYMQRHQTSARASMMKRARYRYMSLCKKAHGSPLTVSHWKENGSGLPTKLQSYRRCLNLFWGPTMWEFSSAK